MQRAKDLFRFLEAAKRTRSGNFRESIALSFGREIICESRAQFDWWEEFTNALKTREIRTDDFGIRDLFETFVEGGREMAQSWGPNNGASGGVSLIEAAGAIGSSDFSHITGQIVYAELIGKLTPEDYPFQQLIPTQQTQFNGEKIAGIAGLGDMAGVVPEGQQFPFVGTTEDWIETPVTTKRGFIVPITKEAIFFDRTGQLLAEAGAVGDSLMLNKEKRAIDCLIDQNTQAHRYKWRGTSYETYNASSPWGNITTGNALVDWTDIDNANQTLNAITDPNTGEPVVVEADTLICCKSLEMTANRIKNATEITVTTPGFATSLNPNQTRQANPMSGAYNVVTSRQLAARLSLDTDWFYGSPSKYAAYMENWGITVVEAPTNNSDDFNRDIVSKFKCSERGQYAVKQPRVMSKCTVA